MASENTVAGWIADTARPVRADTADGPLTDLEPLRDAARGAAGPPHYLLDLRDARARTDAVGAWLGTPAPVRVIGPGYRPADDADHNVQGGAPGTLFDVVVHSREVTPALPLP
ncbi:erythromycin esterase family protein [Spirillospora sp. NPDC052242]